MLALNLNHLSLNPEMKNMYSELHGKAGFQQGKVWTGKFFHLSSITLLLEISFSRHRIFRHQCKDLLRAARFDLPPWEKLQLIFLWCNLPSTITSRKFKSASSLSFTFILLNRKKENENTKRGRRTVCVYLQIPLMYRTFEKRMGCQLGIFWCKLRPTECAAVVSEEVHPIGSHGFDLFVNQRKSFSLSTLPAATPGISRSEDEVSVELFNRRSRLSGGIAIGLVVKIIIRIFWKFPGIEKKSLFER